MTSTPAPLVVLGLLNQNKNWKNYILQLFYIVCQYIRCPIFYNTKMIGKSILPDQLMVSIKPLNPVGCHFKPVLRVHKDRRDSKSGQIIFHSCYNVTYYFIKTPSISGFLLSTKSKFSSSNAWISILFWCYLNNK